VLPFEALVADAAHVDGVAEEVEEVEADGDAVAVAADCAGFAWARVKGVAGGVEGGVAPGVGEGPVG